MKGKIAFVLGAAAGYVLGSRAGRERYEQIKNGAQTLWNTAPVQRGVGVVRDAAQTRVDELKATATRAGKSALAAFLRDDEGRQSASGTSQHRGGAGSSSGGGSASGAEHVATDESEAGPGKRASASKPQPPSHGGSGGSRGSNKGARNGSDRASQSGGDA